MLSQVSFKFFNISIYYLDKNFGKRNMNISLCQKKKILDFGHELWRDFLSWQYKALRKVSNLQTHKRHCASHLKFSMGITMGENPANGLLVISWWMVDDIFFCRFGVLKMTRLQFGLVYLDDHTTSTGSSSARKSFLKN